jgi:ParB-like chromosome segregation protein Spo0J
MAKKKEPPSFLSSLLNQDSLEDFRSSERRKIHYKKLLPHPSNAYSIEGISQLADSIESLGLMQDLLVKPDGKDYIIIVGHRRHAAIKLLVEERGLSEFEEINCVVAPDGDDAASELKLHVSNFLTRELSEYEKLTAITAMKKVLDESGAKIAGRTRDFIAGLIDMGPTQVQKYLSFGDAGNEFIEALKSGGSFEELAKAVADEKRRRNEEKKEDTDAASQPEDGDKEAAPADSEEEIAIFLDKYSELKTAAENIRNPRIKSLLKKLDKCLDRYKI